MHTQNLELRLDGFRYFYRFYPHPASDLDPIMFVSAAFQSMGAWTKLVKHFNRIAPVILVDPPGIGLSDPLPARYGADFLASALRAVVEAAGARAVNVIASSYSSFIAYRFAQLHPDLSNRMVLIGTMKELPSWYIRLFERSIELLHRGRIDTFEHLVLRALTVGDHVANKGTLVKRLMRSTLCNLSPRARTQYEQNTRRLLLAGRLDLVAAPSTPTLVFTGEHDNITRPRYCREVAAALPDAVHTTIQRAGHLVHLHQFGTAVGLTESFLLGRTLEDVPGCTPIEYFRRVPDTAVTGRIPRTDSPVGAPGYGDPATGSAVALAGGRV